MPAIELVDLSVMLPLQAMSATEPPKLSLHVLAPPPAPRLERVSLNEIDLPSALMLPVSSAVGQTDEMPAAVRLESVDVAEIVALTGVSVAFAVVVVAVSTASIAAVSSRPRVSGDLMEWMPFSGMEPGAGGTRLWVLRWQLGGLLCCVLSILYP